MGDWSNGFFASTIQDLMCIITAVHGAVSRYSGGVERKIR